MKVNQNERRANNKNEREEEERKYVPGGWGEGVGGEEGV